MRTAMIGFILAAVLALITAVGFIGCGGDDCSHCCKCDCGSSSMSFSSADCLDCAEACDTGVDIPIIGHMDGCGADLVSFEEFSDKNECD